MKTQPTLKSCLCTNNVETASDRHQRRQLHRGQRDSAPDENLHPSGSDRSRDPEFPEQPQQRQRLLSPVPEAASDHKGETGSPCPEQTLSYLTWVLTR